MGQQRFPCFGTETANLALQFLIGNLTEELRQRHPSWQNDRASLERGIDNLDILGAYEREELVGFVIFEPASGDISSLAVAKDYRRKGIGKSLLKSAVSHFQSDVLKFTNVDCDCESVTGFLSSLGLTPKGQQFEMVRKI